ncbi:MAG: tRNA (guanosine(37)-N1)-methyltransferase TrmD [Erysipelotrichaceae bacterium]|nr:tRNA (guanosine(37)-N1)-methyltransferase TrmD [Erysipelotrichaceae bacterium]
MKITILSLFPEMFNGFLTTSIIKKALDKQAVEIEVVNFRDYTLDRHNHVDDTPYGGGQGMVLSCQPIVDALKAVKTKNAKTYLMAPVGETLSQKKVRELAQHDHLILVCGHYEGFDERISNYVDGALSIGDYVLTGGELASMVISDAVIRTLPGVIVEASHLDESFENELLEYPQYTKPVNYEGFEVPEVLLSGHHENIRKWRLKQSLMRTLKYRPDLLEKHQFSKEELKIMEEIKKND